MTLFLPPLAAALCLFAAHAPSADAGSERLESALRATGLNYSTNASGLSYTLLFDHPGGRKQTIYVSRNTNKVQGILTHTLYTTVWIGRTPPDEALMKRVLSQTEKLGGFYVYKDQNDNWAIRFSVHFDATDLYESSASGDTPVKALRDRILFVNQVGEKTDKELNGNTDIK